MNYFYKQSIVDWYSKKYLKFDNVNPLLMKGMTSPLNLAQLVGILHVIVKIEVRTLVLPLIHRKR
jgi:hypothetical protein